MSGRRMWLGHDQLTVLLYADADIERVCRLCQAEVSEGRNGEMILDVRNPDYSTVQALISLLPWDKIEGG